MLRKIVLAHGAQEMQKTHGNDDEVEEQSVNRYEAQRFAQEVQDDYDTKDKKKISKEDYRGYMRSIAKQGNAVPEAGATKGDSKYTRTLLALYNVAALMNRIILTLASGVAACKYAIAVASPRRRPRRSLSSTLTT